MKRTEYFFDEETLSFKKVNKKSKKYRLKVLYKTFIVLSLSIAVFFGIILHVNTPKERYYLKKLSRLEKETDSLYESTNAIKEKLFSIQEIDENIYREVLEQDKIPLSIRNAGMGGIDKYKEFEGVPYLKSIVKANKEIDDLTKKLYIQSKSYDELLESSKERIKRIQSIPSIMPLSGVERYHFVSGFGYRVHPILKKRIFHKGIDYGAKIGTPVYATGNGKIVRADYESGYGNRVIINHGYGYKTQYGHMSKILVEVGDSVHRGQKIGLVGNTGRSTGPHLHYEVIFNYKVFNPSKFYLKEDLPPELYMEMVKGQEEYFQAERF